MTANKQRKLPWYTNEARGRGRQGQDCTSATSMYMQKQHVDERQCAAHQLYEYITCHSL